MSCEMVLSASEGRYAGAALEETLSVSTGAALCETLFAAEKRYAGAAAEVWKTFAHLTDRYSMEGDDLLLAVATIDLMQQIVSELLAVSLVGALVAAAPPDGFWVHERASFTGTTVAVAPALRREEFVECVSALLSRRGVPDCSPVGRDLRWRNAALRVFDEAARCACRTCYRCPYCTANDCGCWHGDSLEDVEDAQPHCRGGAELELRLDAFLRWQGRPDVAWPSPSLDVVVLVAAISVSEAVNGNAGSAYMGSGVTSYRLEMHTSLPTLWARLSASDPIVQLEMKAYNARQQHIVCR